MYYVKLHESQASFREEISCKDQVFMLTRISQSAPGDGIPVFACFLVESL
jgi:hypothetical protein